MMVPPVAATPLPAVPPVAATTLPVAPSMAAVGPAVFAGLVWGSVALVVAVFAYLLYAFGRELRTGRVAGEAGERRP